MEDRHARHRRADADRRRRPVDGFRIRSTPRFVRLVDDALAGLPHGILALLDDVAVMVAELPPAAPDVPPGPPPLGSYVEGDGPTVPRGLAASDRIVLYRRPLEARASNAAELSDLIRVAIVEELADHLGLDDDRLDELGWS